MRVFSLLIYAALAAGLAGAAHAQPKQTGALAGLPLPDKKVQAIMYASRVVSDLDRSIKFYTEALGLKRVGGFDYDDGSAQEVFLAFDDRPDSVKIALLKQKARGTGPLPATDGLNHVVFQVTDIKAVRDRAVALGGKTGGELHKVNNVWMGGVVDPDGHRIGLVQQD
jgi:lactoylglutathione lyase